MIFTDTHAHLYVKQFENDREAMLQRAMNAGVERFFLPNIDASSIDALHALCLQHPKHCFAMMGLHPCSVGEDVEKQLAIHKKWLFEGGPVKYHAVGEIGIDLHWDKTTLPLQVKAFEEQIAWAKELDLPIIIHARSSFNEIFEVLDRLNDNSLRGVLHCFGGTLEQAQHIINYGNFYVGIGGVLTYKKSGLDAVLPNIPLNKIILETDAPYLAPVPYRGKRNESAYVLHVAEKMAEVMELPLDEIARVTTKNSVDLFRI